ncbi:MAG TPA: 23S rRNA (adenine(2030)-N(6))-methyltransferase RlmJ [Burkholderiaceae bacterium]|nr:23S rRNA (adenine(2030)-N(6))-methyltransferase RlmJ [Burkholderiaceae bacterium]
MLKHTVLVRVLRHMNQKDKPYRLVDTHAGAGGYSLEGRHAQQKGEFENGIARLWSRDDLPPALADYVALVREFNADGTLAQYPGSPAFGQMVLRAQDQLRLFELHPTDHRILASYIGTAKGAEVYDTDGFDGLKGQVPPSSRRAVVLMDPSYEGHRDYGRVIGSLREAIERFADGVYVVWYPQVSKLEAAQLPKRLEALAPKGWLHARLTPQQPDRQGFGLAGSGLFVINPPYTLHDELLTVLPYLTEVLGQYDDANYLLEQRAA